MNNNKASAVQALEEAMQAERKLSKPLHPAAFVRYAKEHDYINYCEGIIARNGYVYPMCGSHTQMLIKMIAKEQGKSLDEIYEEIPRVFWLRMEYYGLKLTKAINLHYDFQQGVSVPSQEQLATLKLLARNGLIVRKYEKLDD